MAEEIQKEEQEVYEEASLTDLEDVSGGTVCVVGIVNANSELPGADES